MLTRRHLLKGAAGAAVLASTNAWRPLAALGQTATATATLPDPASAPFDHVVLLMMENRSFDHFLGWLPGADGRQAGLTFTDSAGASHDTFDLAPDFQGCRYADPDHSVSGGGTQLDGGRVDGFLRTQPTGDTFPIGYYTEASVPVLGALARSYTAVDNYHCSLLGPTFPNRIYQHAARTDRSENTLVVSQLPTIWDRLAAAGLSGGYYYHDLPVTLLWGTKYQGINHPFDRFLADAAAGTLPNVSYVDPAFGGEDTGTSGDDHPLADIRVGQALIRSVYEAVRRSPQWDRTVLVVNYDEWGGFFDHVVPPRAPEDDSTNSNGGPSADFRQMGFRVPAVVASPYAPARTGFTGAPFDHTSVLRMIEWRWGLAPLGPRDRDARNLAEVLDFSSARTDDPAVPDAPAVTPTPCATKVAAATASPPPAGTTLPRTGIDARTAALTGAAAVGAGAAIVGAARPDDAADGGTTR